MKKPIGAFIIGFSFLVPALALAQSDNRMLNGAGIDVSANARAEIGSQNATATAGTSANTSVGTSNAQKPRGNATSSANKAKPRPTQATSSRPSTTSHSTSSANKPTWGQKGGIVGFLRSIFGIAGSSTAELRVEMNASTTASTTGAQGVGFFARLIRIFKSF